MRRGFVAVALVAASCAGAHAGEDRLVVFAAASLAKVLPKVDPAPRYQFAGSDQLALQIREGAPADVFASASAGYASDLSRDGYLSAPVVFATNRLVLIVPAGNPADIDSVQDLRVPGVKLVVGATGVPVGDYARTALRSLGEESILQNAVSEEQDVKGVVGKVALGEADAGFVYATDVAAVQEDVDVVELPPHAAPRIEYAMAVVSDGDRRREAERFLDGMLSPRGRRILAAAGFGLP